MAPNDASSKFSVAANRATASSIAVSLTDGREAIIFFSTSTDKSSVYHAAKQSGCALAKYTLKAS